MKTIRADLHMHGPIGFQDYWRKVQGYEGKNILKEITDSCLNKGVNLTAITSDEDEIPRNSIHDRFNWLKNHDARNLPKGYEFDTLGKNAAMIVRGEEILYLINGQTVRTGEMGNSIDYLVIGTNEVTNHGSLELTARYVYESEESFGGAEHGLCTSHGGMGRANMERLIPYMTFIEGHNSQLIFPVFRGVPVFGSYRRGLNKEARNFALENKIPWIATSDAHRIEDAGLSYIEFDKKDFDFCVGDNIIKGIKNAIVNNKFTAICEYEKIVPWFNWVLQLIIGTKLGRDKE